MTVLVAEDNSWRVIGTIALQVLDLYEGHLRGVAVDQGFQGRGVADRLLCAAEKKLRRLGCSQVTLNSTQSLKRAIRFYLRHGYKISGIVKDFFGMPLFEYVKTLDGEAA